MPPSVHPPSSLIILVKWNKAPFKWRHFEPAIILLCARRYCRCSLSYRALEEVMRERMMRNGRVKRSDGRDAVGYAKFVARLFGVAA